MIEGLDTLLEETGQPGLPELRAALAEMFTNEATRGRLVSVSKLLRSRVFRVVLELQGRERSLVIKRLSPQLAYKEQRVVERWLPRIGMGNQGPPLLRAVAERSGVCIWHVYEDLGSWTLDQQLNDDGCIEIATRQVAAMHMRGAQHPMLAECRLAGEDFGQTFYDCSIRDAIRNLTAIKAGPGSLQSRQRRIVDTLLDKLAELQAQRDYRADALLQHGGPETLLHGDLWTINIFVLPGEQRRVRLIDWDHIGVGPITYDLSTYLLRFPVAQRRQVLDYYQATAAVLDWQLPAADNFNLLCETAELARLATSTIWSAIEACEHRSDWAFAELGEIIEWFDALQPILPVAATRQQVSGL